MSMPERKTDQGILALRPFVIKGTHPVDTGKYWIATNEIERMYETICQWIQNRATGGIIYGRPRLGKTWAIDYLKNVLPDEFTNLPIFFFKCRHYRVPNEGTFFEYLLKDIGHGVVYSGKTNVKRDRLLKYLIERSSVSCQNRVILFVDDAQLLCEIQYGWLMDIYNDLATEGICLTVILVGQEELLSQRSAFIMGEKKQIVGRFMVHEHKFSGVKTVSDIHTCLEGYDNAVFPENSGWSFTRYYFQDQYDVGMRLVDYSDDLFDLFKEISREIGIKKNMEVPMQYLTLTIEYTLRKFGDNGISVDKLTKNHWREAIEKSGFVEAEKYVLD